MNSAFDFDFVHTQASALSGGLTDFGSPDYHDSLRLLLSDYDRHARLSELGAQMCGSSVINDLAGRLHEEAGFKAHAADLDHVVTKPIFIIGMARTGTTVLLRLLAADPAKQCLPLWLGMTPMRRPPQEEWQHNVHYQQVQDGLAAIGQISPTFQAFHPQHAAAADECRYVLHHTFRSPSLTVMADVPNYTAWLNQADMNPAYERYQRVLNLISVSAQQWVLKCPSHLWSLPAILKTFPDACIVMTHRDPVKSFPSLFDLVYQMRQYTEAGVTPQSYGRSNFGIWGWVLDKSERDRAEIDDSRIFDIHCDQIRRDPIGSVRAIHAHFDIPVTDQAIAEWTRMSNESPTGGHASHPCSADDFDLSAREILDSTGSYYERYRQVETAGA